MSQQLIHNFEKLWFSFRSRWCNHHDLRGAIAFSHDHIKIPFFHRVVNVHPPDTQVDRLIQDATDLFKKLRFDCTFTLSPLDRPENLTEHLCDHGFKPEQPASVMIYEHPITQPHVTDTVEIERSGDREYEMWVDIMCHSFRLPRSMGDVGRSVLNDKQTHRYLARKQGVPAGTLALYSQFGMGCIDFVGTLPEHRQQGVASALVTQAVLDSQSMGNQWTLLETTSGSEAERLYRQHGFRTVYRRKRYTRPFTINH